MVFLVSVTIVLFFVVWGVLAPEGLAENSNLMLKAIIENFGWFYLWVTLGFLIFAVYLAFSPYGSIRLGKDDERPEYSNFTWFGMLFSAGMGIGLVFWGVAEPISHYISPPADYVPRTPDAARAALRFAFFHWGLHPWAIYTVLALTLAYFQFRKGLNGLISSTFFPLIGFKINGIFGHIIDILAVIATAFGVATSLGLGTMQVNGGLAYLFGIQNSTMSQMLIIVVVTVLYMLSATTGLDKGIKILSNINILLAVSLLLFVLFAGPTSFIMDSLTLTLGGYFQNLVQMSLRLSPFTQGTWVGQWTLFYWAWWISWAPFVGTFIARVSRGRTIREFVAGVLLIPSLFSFLWFAVFGATALNLEIFQRADIAGAVQQDITAALFSTFGHLPMGAVISFFATLLIITFFITSADSAIFVLGMFSTNGSLNPSNKIKLTWGVLQSAVAAVLLISGGLTGLQTASIIIALPFAVIIVLMCVSILRALSKEKIE